MSLKVLFVYPNYRGMNMLPPAIGLLSAVLKDAGFQVRLFDTTYYESVGDKQSDSDRTKSDRLMARPYKMPNEISLKTTDVFADFEHEVDTYAPDLIALSCTEDMWHLGIGLLRRVEGKHHGLTIAGGVFPTFAPKLVLEHPEVDMVCVGEGEDALRTLCERLESGRAYDDIPSLWVKQKDGSTRRNPTKLVSMDANPLIDMSIFEEARFYRPMAGKVWRMFPVETHRGCPYLCAFCNSPSQMEMYRTTGQNYLRRKSFDNMFRELSFYKNEMKAEYLYFWADTFFVWQHDELDTFAEMYKEIGLPFWCQTRVETVTHQRLEKLQEMGCARMSFGLEHGNEQFRTTWLKRPMKNSMIVDKFKIVNDVGIPFSVNNIMGFPHETRELAFDTVRLNRQFSCADRNAYTFTPFAGTPLRDECERLGYLQPSDVVRSVVTDGSLLDMPTFPKRDVLGLVKTFNMYVRFPEERWPQIRKAEEGTPEGQKLFDDLKAEFVDRFWREQSSTSFEDASMA